MKDRSLLAGAILCSAAFESAVQDLKIPASPKGCHLPRLWDDNAQTPANHPFAERNARQSAEEIDMPMHTCTGGQMVCAMGTSPAVFNATPKMVVTSSMPAGNIMDFVPMTNIPPFGMCMSPANPMVAAATAAAQGVLTPMPCIPAPAGPWTPGAVTVLVAQSPGLDNTSMLTCTWAGVITFTDPGQATELIP